MNRIYKFLSPLKRQNKQNNQNKLVNENYKYNENYKIEMTNSDNVKINDIEKIKY